MRFLLVALLLSLIYDRARFFGWAFGLHGVVIIGLRYVDGWMMIGAMRGDGMRDDYYDNLYS